MTRYSKPVWQMVKEAVEALGEATAKDVKEYIRRKYPEDNVKESTIGAQVIACSVNHSSAHHYPNSKRFLFYLGNGRYRLYDPNTDGHWKITSTGAQRIIEERKSDKTFFSQVGSNGQIRLPRIIKEKLSIKDNDFIAFIEDKEGNILLKKAELQIV